MDRYVDATVIGVRNWSAAKIMNSRNKHFMSKKLLQNMMRALNQVKQNKGYAGVDRMPVSELYDYLTNNRESIEQSLLDGTVN